MPRPHRLRRLAVACFAACCLSAHAADPVALDIPAQPLAAALAQFSAQSGVRALYAADLLAGKTAPRVAGRMSPEAALAQLLKDSGLVWRALGEGAVRIEAAPREGASVELPELTITASQGAAEAGRYRTEKSRTATKTNTPILETPASVQSLPKAVLDDQQAVLLEDGLKNISGVFLNQGLVTDSYAIRGFNNDREGFGTSYRDGVRTQQRGRFSLANIERVEVLKGPASILYGRSEPGGFVNLVTKRPQEVAAVSLTQQVGSYDLYRTQFDATGPLTADGALSYRVNVEQLNTDSFRDFQFIDRTFVAPSLRWRISPQTLVDFDLIYQKEATRQDVGIPAIDGRPANVPISRWVGDPTDSFKSALYQIGLKVDHAFNDAWSLTGRYTFIHDKGLENVQFYPAIFDEATGILQRGYFASGGTSRSHTVSLDLTGKFDAGGVGHTLLLGLDHYNWDDKGRGTSFSFPGDPVNPAPLDIFNPDYDLAGFDAALTPFPAFGVEASQKRWSGVYAQDQIALTERWQLLIGARYDRAQLRNSFGTDLTDSELSQRYGLLYRLSDTSSVYASYVEGFNAANTSQVVSGKPQPETSFQYEIGYKAESSDQRFSGTLALYELTKENVSVPASDPALALLGFSELVGEQQSRGVEVDLAGQLTDALRVVATYSYTEAEISKDRDDAGGTGRTGNRLHSIPKHAASVWSTWDFTGQGVRGLVAGLGVYRIGERAGDNDNSFILPAYTRVDAMLKYAARFAGTPVTWQVNVNNVFDKTYYASGDFNAQPGAPRAVTGSVKIEF